ncbi:MAG: T9SS type A sorting domain-containing protein [Winogradskyella sp.]
MIKKLLLVLVICAIQNSVVAQDTYNIEWSFGSNSNVTPATAANNADRTIEVGDTVQWNFTSGNHNVSSKPTSQESFTSGALQGAGFTFSKTFTQIGTNEYQCDPHSGSMFGVITVVADGSLSVPTFKEAMEAINVYPNPASSNLNIAVPSQLKHGLTIEVFDVLGKKIVQKSISKLTTNISIAQWHTGVYLVKLSSIDKGTSITKKVVKI